MATDLKRGALMRGVAMGLIVLLVGAFLLKSCAPESGPKPAPAAKVEQPMRVPTPLFDADSAYGFVAKQVAFGPRVPGSAGHRACADWLVATLKRFGADTVIEQRGTVTAFNGQPVPLRNIIASWWPERKERLLLVAHYDTRPYADRDDERRNEPILGANDGASGVGVWLEVARLLRSTPAPNVGIDIFFTDVEDMGQPDDAMGAGSEVQSLETWCLGSRYWARNPHVSDYRARFGILLDMVGSTGARFPREAISMRLAPQVVAKIWSAAAAVGHGDRFQSMTRQYVGIDDHLVITEGTGIPVADIIAFDESTNAFPRSWHTHDDNMSGIDKASLAAVGTTVMQVIWAER